MAAARATAACCRVLPRAAACCRVLPRAATCCRVLHLLPRDAVTAAATAIVTVTTIAFLSIAIAKSPPITTHPGPPEHRGGLP